jgi:phage-related protein
VKEVRWLGDSRSVVAAFPKSARLKIGQELTRVQLGADPKHGKALSGLGGGVPFRVIYVASIGTRVCVLHAFHKKSKQGIETPKSEIELARRRYRMLIGEGYE